MTGTQEGFRIINKLPPQLYLKSTQEKKGQRKFAKIILVFAYGGGIMGKHFFAFIFSCLNFSKILQ